MFGKRLTLFRLLGFSVRVDLSWIFIAGLVTWSLGSAFHEELPALSLVTCAGMGFAGMLGLFCSVVFHELSHSLVARRNGIEMHGITLFIFGGVAEMLNEPPSARAEFLMAIVGPLASFFLALVLKLLESAAVHAGFVPIVSSVLGTLSLINLGLAVFNLIPGFPLDGGRVLRAVLWGVRKDLHWATRVASGVGTFFGFALMAMGILSFTGVLRRVGAGYVSGVWWFLIGMFLRNAARRTYRQLVARSSLESLPVHRFMKPNPLTVSPDTTLEALVELLREHPVEMIPVVAPSGHLVGVVTLRALREVPRETWSQTRVSEVLETLAPNHYIGPDTEALSALNTMSRHGHRSLLVVENDVVLGILSGRDLFEYLSLQRGV
jgi:Zn-dependent protease